MNISKTEREHFHKILDAWIDGKEIESSYYPDCWINQTKTIRGGLLLQKGANYRIKPKATPLPIPDELWRFIKPEFNYAAMDENKCVCFYKCKPIINSKNSYWYDSKTSLSRTNNSININTDGIDWRLSLTERPEGC